MADFTHSSSGPTRTTHHAKFASCPSVSSKVTPCIAEGAPVCRSHTSHSSESPGHAARATDVAPRGKGGQKRFEFVALLLASLATARSTSSVFRVGFTPRVSIVDAPVAIKVILVRILRGTRVEGLVLPVWSYQHPRWNGARSTIDGARQIVPCRVAGFAADFPSVLRAPKPWQNPSNGLSRNQTLHTRTSRETKAVDIEERIGSRLPLDQVQGPVVPVVTNLNGALRCAFQLCRVSGASQTSGLVQLTQPVCHRPKLVGGGHSACGHRRHGRCRGHCHRRFCLSRGRDRTAFARPTQQPTLAVATQIGGPKDPAAGHRTFEERLRDVPVIRLAIHIQKVRVPFGREFFPLQGFHSSFPQRESRKSLGFCNCLGALDLRCNHHVARTLLKRRSTGHRPDGVLGSLGTRTRPANKTGAPPAAAQFPASVFDSVRSKSASSQTHPRWRKKTPKMENASRV